MGPATILKGQAGCGNIWLVNMGGANVRLRNVKLDGNKVANAAYTTTTLCYVTGADALVEDCVGINSPGYGFFFEAGVAGMRGRNLLADGCTSSNFYVRAATTPNGNATE